MAAIEMNPAMMHDYVTAHNGVGRMLKEIQRHFEAGRYAVAQERARMLASYIGDVAEIEATTTTAAR